MARCYKMTNGFVIGTIIVVTFLIVIIIITMVVLLNKNNGKEQDNSQTDKNSTSASKKKVENKIIVRREDPVFKETTKEKRIPEQPKFILHCGEPYIQFDDKIYTIDVKFSYNPEFSLDGICLHNDKIIILSKGYLHVAEIKCDTMEVKTMEIPEESDLCKVNGEMISLGSIPALELIMVQTEDNIRVFNLYQKEIRTISYNKDSRRIYGSNLEDYLDYDLKLLTLHDSSGKFISGCVTHVDYISGHFDYRTA